VQGKFRFNADDGPIPGQYQVLIVPNPTKALPNSSAKVNPGPKDFRLDATVPESSPFELNFKIGQ
jgi:hypothetical protein